jgi:hypothetical protein
LFRVRHQFTIVTTLTEQMLRMGLLEIAAADLAAGNVRGDREDRHTAAVGVVEAIDKMQIPWSATARTDG